MRWCCGAWRRAWTQVARIRVALRIELETVPAPAHVDLASWAACSPPAVSGDKEDAESFMYAQHHYIHLHRSPLLKVIVSEPTCLRFVNYIRCRTPRLCLVTETEISDIDPAYC